MVSRSKTPDLVLQELWDLLLTHFAICQLMIQAAWPPGLDTDRLRFTCAVLYHGLRRAELCRSKVDDVQQRRGVVHLPIHGKGDKLRYVPLHPATASRLDAYLQEEADAHQPTAPFFSSVGQRQPGRPRQLRTQCAGEQRFGADAHLIPLAWRPPRGHVDWLKCSRSPGPAGSTTSCHCEWPLPPETTSCPPGTVFGPWNRREKRYDIRSTAWQGP